MFTIVTKEKIQVYPNPAINEVTVRGLSEARLRIMDLEGRVIRDILVTGNSSVPINDLQVGVYLVRMDHEDQTMITKLFKTR